MSIDKKRIEALKAVVAGSIIPSTKSQVINNEFQEVYRVHTIQPLARRRLLQILHSTRALDSFLSEFTNYYGCRGTNHSLGSYLRSLENHASPRIARLKTGRSQYYQNKIVNQRNHYMHEAGASPSNDKEIASILAEMQVCLVEISSL